MVATINYDNARYFFVRAVILVQTEHVNDNFQELLRFCLFLVSWLEDFCKDLVELTIALLIGILNICFNTLARMQPNKSHSTFKN